jgi:hypothetical protein
MYWYRSSNAIGRSSGSVRQLVVSLKPSFNALSKYFEALQRRKLWTVNVRVVETLATVPVVMSLPCAVERIGKSGSFVNDEVFVVGRRS